MSNPEQTDSEFVVHTECEKCGSRDNAAVYTDGHTYCFGCGDWQGDGDGPQRVESVHNHKPLIRGSFRALRSRRLTEETCKKFGYTVAKHSGQPVQLAMYRDTKGNPCAQKVRTADKKFSIVGDAKAMTLFGSHLWSNGLKLIVTEGELDAMSISQIQNHKWPVVSLPNGSTSARKALLKNYDYITGFKEVILFYDNDTPGRDAANACAEALPIGLCKIATIGGFKDANEALVAGDAQAVVNAIFQARPYQPDGIVSAVDLRDVIGVEDTVSAITYPYPQLNELTKGIRLGTLTTIAAGSGTGKSTFVREIMYHIQQSGFPVGMMMLEETTKRSMQAMVGMHMNKNIVVDPGVATRDDIETSFDDLIKHQPIYLFDHFGSTDLDRIINRIRYMSKALGCQVICLDHISILVSGMTGEVADERRLVDSLVTQLRTEVQALGIALLLVSHLKRPSSDLGHESGARVSLSQLRSSHAIAQLSDFVLGLEVDREDPTSGLRNLVCLKNRHTGEVGHAGTLSYDRTTGRLTDAGANFGF